MKRKTLIIITFLLTLMNTMGQTNNKSNIEKPLLGTHFATQRNVNTKRSDRKIIEICKIVKLSKQQEKAIRKAYDNYMLIVDRTLYEIKDAAEAVQMKYEANKAFHQTLMQTLTEAQRLEYIRVSSTPEITEKTNYKVSLLEEYDDYTESELQEKWQEIFNYLMNEKVVYVRDKFDIKKQKENISRLKNTQPRSMRESNIREKQKGQGKSPDRKNGK